MAAKWPSTCMRETKQINKYMLQIVLGDMAHDSKRCEQFWRGTRHISQSRSRLRTFTTHQSPNVRMAHGWSTHFRRHGMREHPDASGCNTQRGGFRWWCTGCVDGKYHQTGKSLLQRTHGPLMSFNAPMIPAVFSTI
jgi:hypothetical protein